jgi:hypothetical protein
LLDNHLLPDYQTDSNGLQTVVASSHNGWICFTIGNVGLMLVVLCQHVLHRHLKADRIIHWLVGYHLFTYIMAFFNVCHWRGVWILLNVYTGYEAVSVWTSLAIGNATI